MRAAVRLYVVCRLSRGLRGGGSMTLDAATLNTILLCVVVVSQLLAHYQIASVWRLVGAGVNRCRSDRGYPALEMGNPPAPPAPPSAPDGVASAPFLRLVQSAAVPSSPGA